MPVKVSPVALTAVPNSDTYVATIKSRRTTTLQPQVDGNITRILVASGQSVKAGQVLMQIDPLKQVATVQTQAGLENQQKAVYQYNQAEVERQKKLYEAGITSRQVYDQAVQAFENSKASYESSAAGTNTQRQQLAYYQIRAPFAGIVGDIPVHQGDYVSSTTLLTTVDEDTQLEAYIYLPTERAAQARIGLPVDLIDTTGQVLTHSTISFVSPQVDNGLQSILAKAPSPPPATSATSRSSTPASPGTPPRSRRPCPRRHPHRRPGLRLRRQTQPPGPRLHRPPGSRHPRRDSGQQLPRPRRPATLRQGHPLWPAVPPGRRSGPAARLRQMSASSR